MKLFINGVDISQDQDVRITQCTLDTYANGYSDTLKVECGDSEKLWASWNLQCGDTIAVEGDDGFASGKMYVTKIARGNQYIRITGRSVPLSRNTSRYKKWQDVRLSEIGSEIASRLNLTFENYDVQDYFYDELIQNNQSDLSFLSDLLAMECAGLLVFNDKLVAYDKAGMEKESVGELYISVDGEYEFTSSMSNEYSSCTLHWSEYDEFEPQRFVQFVSKNGHPLEVNIEASQSLPGIPLEKTKPEFTAPDDGWYRGQWYPDKVEYEGTATADSLSPSSYYTDKVRVTSNDQAARWAKGILRSKNENYITGSFVRPLLGAYSAGTVVSLEFEMSPDLNGDYFIDHIFHNYKANRSVAYVHKCLRW